MREQIVLPLDKLHRSTTLSYDQLALVEMLGIGAHAVGRAAIEPGEWALVVGAGPIGVGTGIFARLAGGAVTLMDLSEGRLAFLADSFGFADGIRAGEDALAEIDRRTGGDRYDVVFDATGNARAMERSFDFVASGGTLVLVGVRNAEITFSDPEFHRKEMTVKATRNATRADFETVMAAVRAGQVPMDALNTHSGALDDLPVAMPEWMHGAELPLKAVVTV
jgi:2-desacetyl-2-hydroxyethyl bacteriochlorophyllide A dehydrogenase